MFWLGAIVSLCYVPGITGAYIATQWPVLAVLMSFGLWRKGPFTTVHAIGLLFVAYACLRLPFTPDLHFSMFGLWLIVIMGLCLWFGTTMTSVKELYAGLAVGGAVSSFVAVLQHFGFTYIPTTSPDPAGLYVNSVQQGTVLALVVVALVSERMWIWAVPLLPGIWLAHSRGAWLALAIGLLACYVRRVWVFGIVAAVGVFYLLNPLNSHDLERTFIWQAAWNGLTWVGWGPGTFYSVILSRDGGVTNFFPEYAHNDALQLLFEYGIGAVLLFVVLGYALWRKEAKGWPVVVAFVAAGCYSMPLFMPITSFLAFVAVGHILRGGSLAVGNSGYRGWHVLSRAYGGGTKAVPVASIFVTEG